MRLKQAQYCKQSKPLDLLIYSPLGLGNGKPCPYGLWNPDL